MRLLSASNVIDKIFGFECLLCFCSVSLSLIDCLQSRQLDQMSPECRVSSNQVAVSNHRIALMAVSRKFFHCVVCKCVGWWETIKLPYLWITFNHWTRGVIDFFAGARLSPKQFWQPRSLFCVSASLGENWKTDERHSALIHTTNMRWWTSVDSDVVSAINTCFPLRVDVHPKKKKLNSDWSSSKNVLQFHLDQFCVTSVIERWAELELLCN